MTMTTTEIKRMQLLDWLYLYERQHPGVLAEVVNFTGVPDLNEQNRWRQILRGLQADGLIVLSEAMGFDGLAATLTTHGNDNVEQRAARRANTAARRAACRDSLLRWLYAQPGH